MGSAGLLWEVAAFFFSLSAVPCAAPYGRRRRRRSAGRFPLKLILYLLSLDTGGCKS